MHLLSRDDYHRRLQSTGFQRDGRVTAKRDRFNRTTKYV